MKITMVGTGYVGLTVGVCLAELGNEVICMDVDEKKINGLKEGKLPIYEPGLGELLARNVKENRLSFTTDMKDAIEKSTVIFIAVGTPPDKDHRADLKFVRMVASDIGKYMNEYKVIVDKSTVPVGTGEMVAGLVKENQPNPIDFDVVSNPEFLREGEAIGDFSHPDRIVIGVSSEKAEKIMRDIYGGIIRTGKPLVVTDVKSAELIKYASNAMLATRISFMNEIAQLCEKAGADVKSVAKGMGLDSRIGPRFLQAGVGYGGSCFPKDVNALVQTMQDYGVAGKILNAVEDVNFYQKQSLLPKIETLVGDLKGKTIAIWGLAFKPKTDDMREAPSLVVIKQLQEKGATIRAFDPEAEENAKQMLEDVEYCATPLETLKNSHCLVIVTEWNEFRNIDKNQIKDALLDPNVIDGRNVYEPNDMRELGFNYVGVGRG